LCSIQPLNRSQERTPGWLAGKACAPLETDNLKGLEPAFRTNGGRFFPAAVPRLSGLPQIAWL